MANQSFLMAILRVSKPAQVYQLTVTSDATMLACMHECLASTHGSGTPDAPGGSTAGFAYVGNVPGFDVNKLEESVSATGKHSSMLLQIVDD